MINRLKIFSYNSFKRMHTLIIVFGIYLFLLYNLPLKAQTKIDVTQALSFGTFYTGSTGGTVIMPSVGSRQATGSVVLFQSDPGNPAIVNFRIKRTQIITITSGGPVYLTNGSGGSMLLEINDFFPASPFSAKNSAEVYIGGTLTVGSPATSTAGNYIGTFDFTINLQ